MARDIKDFIDGLIQIWPVSLLWLIVMISFVLPFVWKSFGRALIKYSNQTKGRPTNKIDDQTLLRNGVATVVILAFVVFVMYILLNSRPSRAETVLGGTIVVFGVLQLIPFTRTKMITLQNILAGTSTKITPLTHFWYVLTGLFSVIFGSFLLYSNLINHTTLIFKLR